MICRRRLSVALFAAIVALVGCKQEPPKPTFTAEAFGTLPEVKVEFPELGRKRNVIPGVKCQQVTLRRGNMPMRIWIYQPATATATDKLPLILFPPWGRPPVVGMYIQEPHQDLICGYVEFGYAVACFDIDGHVSIPWKIAKDMLEFSKIDERTARAAREFRDAQAGLANVKTTLDYISAKVPNIDQRRIYIAGLMNAGTLSLLAAEFESRIKASIAFMPIIDTDVLMGKSILDLEKLLPGTREFVRVSSPKTHIARLKCPVFLMHFTYIPAGFPNILPDETKNFAELLKKTNSNVTLFLEDNKEDVVKKKTWELGGFTRSVVWLNQIWDKMQDKDED